MKLPKIDIKGIVTKAAGHGAGLLLVKQVNELEFMKKQEKPKTKGAITAALGYIGVPLVLGLFGIKGGKKGDFAGHVGDGMGIFGLAQVGAEVSPKYFPKIGDVDGYESNPYTAGTGYETSEDVVSGPQEENPFD